MVLITYIIYFKFLFLIWVVIPLGSQVTNEPASLLAISQISKAKEVCSKQGCSSEIQPSHINGSIVCIWKGKLLASDSKCPLKIKSNRGKNWNLLNENWEDKISNADSVQVFGKIKKHKFVSTWFDANNFVESNVTVTYQDSIPRDSLPLTIPSDLPFSKVVFEFAYLNRKDLDRYEYYWNRASKFQYGVVYLNARRDN